MNIQDNLPPGAAEDINAPFNVDVIECTRCMGTGRVKGGEEACPWCGGDCELTRHEYDLLYAEEMENREL